MLTYCTHCKSIVVTAEGKCPDCTTPLPDKPCACRYYVCEPQQGPGLVLNLEPGQTLLDGRYTTKSLLGRGSLATVYLAEDSVRGPEEVALKILPLVSDDLAHQLKRDIESHYGIADYSQVMRLYDVHVIPYEGVLLLLASTEYADGGTLRSWLVKNKDNVCKRQTEGLSYFKQACRGVKALHAAGIIHGNLRPENLLFVGGILKVSDLGFSRCLRNLQKDGYNHQQLDVRFLADRAEYRAPEQFMAARSGGNIDVRVDIYSLGAILFQIFDPQARPPFEGTHWQLRQRHLNVPAPILENAGASVTRVAARCLQKAPADRYGTITELMDDLEGGGSTRALETSQVGTEPSTKPVQELWDQACQFMDASNLNAARRLCDRILGIFPEYSQAGDMRDEIDSRFEQVKQFYQAIKNGIGNQSLEQLSTLLAEAVEIYPDHPDGQLVQTQLLSVSGEYRDARDGGLEAIGQGHLTEAQRHFERARQLNPGSSHIVELLDFVSNARRQVDSGRANIDAAIQRQDWNRAMSLARDVDRYVESIKQTVSDPGSQEQRP